MLVTLILHLIFFRPILFIAVDAETAQAIGLPAKLYDLFLHLSIGLAIAITVKVTGILFVFGSLTIAPLIGLLWGRKTHGVFAISVFSSLISVLLGLYLSYLTDMPSAAMIVAVYGLIWLVSFVSAKRKR